MKIRRFFGKTVAMLLLVSLTMNPALAAGGHTVTVADSGGKGAVTVSVQTAAKGAAVTGTAMPGSGYELATVRYAYTLNGAQTYGFADLKKSASGYDFSFAMPDADVTVTASFFSTAVWDGAVDISWYDPAAATFDISQPAQLAGLAALVNGLTDKSTPDWMIKGDRSLLKTTAYPNFLLVGAGGGNVSDTVYASATDFAYKTIRLTADLDMGGVYNALSGTWSGPNYTPVGGKYPMAPDVATGDCFVIDTRFNGVFDGQGHTVSNINCQRYAVKGFPYCMAVGLIGYLGGPSDVPGVVSGTFDKGWQPAVRNVIVGPGYIYGRRMVGGVVGRTGITTNGVIVENCANFATVKNTDAKGVSGVLGTGWGPGVVRNCYNAGSISTDFPCPAGGICGSDGGMDIYNCYNTGKIDSNGQQMGRGIGSHEEGTYTVDNCYYLAGTTDDPSSPGFYLANNKNIAVHVTEMNGDTMKTDAFLGLLNKSGAAFAPDAKGINNGYPVLFFQAASYDSAKTYQVTVKQPTSGGTVSASATGSVSAGRVVDLSCAPAAGYKLDYYTLNGEKLKTSFVTAASDVTVSAVFSAVKPVKITYSESPDFALIVTKTGYDLDDGKLVWVKDKPVHSGDTLLEENIVTVKTFGYDDAAPADPSLQFTDGYTITTTNAQQTADGVFSVDGSADVTLSVTRGTEPKTWLTAADTSWYDKNLVKASYTLTTPAQLAGLAVLVTGGVSFVNTTILLGNDISLKNDDGTSGTRLWRAIGASAFKAFKGTFDGQGHTVRGLDGYSAGSYAGLFGCCTGAVIKNVTVRGKVTNAGSLSYAAGIVASASGCTIENCRNDADITIADSNAGGIAAYISDGTTVSGCTNSGNITASSGVGGIVGVSYTAADVIKNCENMGAVTATGGGTSGIGGIAGKLTGTVANCANTGDVKSEDRYTGGLVGYASGRNSSAVSDAYNTGAVSSNCSKTNAAAGGLVGYAQYITLENCYNSGLVTTGGGFATQNIGGAVGRLGTSGCTITNCYYLETSCKAAVAGSEDDGALPKQAADMTASAFAASLNARAFTAAVGSGYPILAWQAGQGRCTVTFIGDYSGKTTVPRGGSADLPEAPKGYAFALIADGAGWDGQNITADVTVSVTKTLRTYTATFTADGIAVGKETFKYGDTSVKAPDVPQKDGYAAFWQPYKLDAFDITIKAVYRQNVILGGDKITKDGTYFVQYYSTGNIEIGEGVNAVLNGVNGVASGFTGLTVTADAKATLTLDSFKTSGDSTLLTLKGYNTLTLAGDSALTGTSDKKGNATQTVRLEGDATISGSGTLYIRSGIGNAAVFVAPGATLTQVSGTLEVRKDDLLGVTGGAVFAPDAAVAINGGTFSGYTNSDNVSIISAKSLSINGGSVTAIAEKSPVTFDAAEIRITGGSVKSAGHSGNSMSISRWYFNGDSMPAYKGGLAVAALGAGWSDAPSAVTMDGQSVTLGTGHLGLDTTSGGAGTTDTMLYLWLTKADHTVTVDGKSLTLHWDAASSSFGISGPADVYTLTLSAGSLQVQAGAGVSPDRHVVASICDAAGKMLASGSLNGQPSLTLPFTGASFKLRLLETAQDWKPFSDYAYTVHFAS